MFFKKKKDTDIDVLQKIKEKIAEDDNASSVEDGNTSEIFVDDSQNNVDAVDDADVQQTAIDDISKIVENSIVANDNERDSFESSLESDFLSDVLAEEDSNVITTSNLANNVAGNNEEENKNNDNEDIGEQKEDADTDELEEEEESRQDDNIESDDVTRRLGSDGKWYTEDDLMYKTADELRALGLLDEQQDNSAVEEHDEETDNEDADTDELEEEEETTEIEDEMEKNQQDDNIEQQLEISDEDVGSLLDELDSEEDGNEDEEDIENTEQNDIIDDVVDDAEEVQNNINVEKTVFNNDSETKTMQPASNASSAIDVSSASAQSITNMQQSEKSTDFPLIPNDNNMVTTTQNPVRTNKGNISASTKENVKGSITDLIENVKNQILTGKQRSKVNEFSGQKTLEQFIGEIIQPKIVEYLDKNLDRIVRDAVDIEIQKIVGDLEQE